jgi:hypothetical protein
MEDCEKVIEEKEKIVYENVCKYVYQTECKNVKVCTLGWAKQDLWGLGAES